MRERRVLWVVLAAFVVGLVAAAGLAAVDDSGSGPPRLPALAAGEAAGAKLSADAASAMPISDVEYRVSGTLPALADRASAWNVDAGDVGVDDVRRLSAALGLDGAPKADESGWVVADADHQVRVERFAGAPWNYGPVTPDCGPDTAVSSDGAVSTPTCAIAGSGTATSGSASGSASSEEIAPPSPPATTVESCPMPDCPPGTACAQVCPAPTPEPGPEPEPPQRPADLPSKAEAEDIARAFLSRAGLDLGGADVRVDDGFSQWMVTAEPRIGGLPTQGFGWSVAVGPKGEIEYANGWLADPAEGDVYPLAGVDAGIERLKSGAGWGWSPYPGPEPLIARDAPACVDCRPQVRTITGVRLGLMYAPVFTADGPPAEALLVPSYFFGFDDTEYEQPVVAVADEFLPKPPDVEPQPAPEPGRTEPGGSKG